MKPHTPKQNAAPRNINHVGVIQDSFGDQSRIGTPTLDRARALYRSMNTYDIAQLLHVPEAQVYRAVFGTRAALLQRNAGAIGFPQAKQEIKS